MISLHRSMHSSQMYTPGPAMSFLTCFWLFPQNEHLSRSPPSPNFAMSLGPLARRRDLLEVPAVDHLVDDPVLLGLLGAHDVVAVGVLGDPLDVLPGVLGQELVQQLAH